MRSGGCERIAPASAPARTRPARWPALLPDLLFALALLLHALPVLVWTYFPTQDGPMHVENVMALLHRDGVEVLRQHLAPNWGLQPNWLTQLLFAGLTSVLSPLAAQRAVLTGYVLLLPLAARFALPPTPRGRWAALAIFPFLYSFAFHMGFWNFSYGLALLFTVLGVWRRTRGRLGPLAGAGLALLLVVAYFCHTVAVSASLATIATVVGWRCGLGLLRARGKPGRRSFLLRAYGGRAAALAVAAAPAVLLLLRFLARHEDHRAVRLPLLAMAGKLATLYALVSVDRREMLLSLPVALAFATLVVLRLSGRRGSGRARWYPADGWLAAALVFVLLYFATPDVAAGGAQISDRLALLPFLTGLLWLGSGAGPATGVRRVAVVMLLCSAGALALRIPRWRAIERDLREYASVAGAVDRGTVLLPITFAPYGLARDGGRQAWRIRPFQHAAGYVASARDALDLDNAQLNTDYGPVRLARGPNPFRTLGSPDAMEGDPPCVDLAAWRRAGGALDVILLFGATPATASDRCSRATLAALEREFDVVATSRPRGLVQVFRARDGGPPPGHTASR